MVTKLLENCVHLHFNPHSLHHYRPQTKFGARQHFQKRVSRILFTGGGGSASVHAGIPPPGPGTPPEPGTPPGARHPPPPPGAGTPPDQALPLGPGTPRPGTPGSKYPLDQAPPRAEHAGRYGQRAGSTHPTGMQSCFVYELTDEVN